MSADLKILAASELFHGVPGAQLEKLAALAEVMPVASGANLFRLGDTADNLYLVARGRVALMMPIEIDGVSQDLTVDEKGAGEIVGWSALVPPHRSTLAARVLIDSELVAFPATAMQQALAAEPQSGHRVMANLSAVVGRRLHQVQAMWLRELQRLVSARYS